jgi:hypothetical protein
MSPSPWTPQQASAFTGALRIVLNYVGTLHEIVRAAYSRLAANQELLVQHRVIHADELEATTGRALLGLPMALAGSRQDR